MQADLFGAYVRAELEHWGRAFALHRDCEYLGHQSKNVLAVLMEHEGEMPERAQGFKPLETDTRAQVIEDAVCDLAKVNPARAAVLRGYYCGEGRRGEERYVQALELMAKYGCSKISRSKYFAEHDLGFSEIRGYLRGLCQAA